MKMEFLNELLTLFIGLAGFAAFIAFVVNVLKRFGVVTDGNAAIWVKWLNLIGLVIVGVLYLLVPGAIPVVDQVLGLLAQLGGVLFPILALALGWPVANGISGKVHNGIRGFPLLGYSHKKG
jgi:hypothetical protein